MAARQVYEIVGRYINEDDARDVVGYHLKSVDGSKQGRYSVEQVAFLIGRDQVSNCAAQIYKDKILFRGKGITLESLPSQKVKVNKPSKNASKQADTNVQPKRQQKPVVARPEQPKPQVPQAPQVQNIATEMQLPPFEQIISGRNKFSKSASMMARLAKTLQDRYSLQSSKRVEIGDNIDKTAIAIMDGSTKGVNIKITVKVNTLNNKFTGIDINVDKIQDNKAETVISKRLKEEYINSENAKNMLECVCKEIFGLEVEGTATFELALRTPEKLTTGLNVAAKVGFAMQANFRDLYPTALKEDGDRNSGISKSYAALEGTVGGHNIGVQINVSSIGNIPSTMAISVTEKNEQGKKEIIISEQDDITMKHTIGFLARKVMDAMGIACGTNQNPNIASKDAQRMLV